MGTSTMDSNSARSNWRALLDTASKGEDVVVTRFGKPVVAMIDYEDYVAILEELDDRRAARRANAVLDDIESGQADTESWEDVKADLFVDSRLDD